VCNPNDSGGRDQEDCSLRPAQAKIPNTKKDWQSAQGAGPEYCKKRKKERKKESLQLKDINWQNELFLKP
jgi:hypothetical protein